MVEAILVRQSEPPEAAGRTGGRRVPVLWLAGGVVLGAAGAAAALLI